MRLGTVVARGTLLLVSLAVACSDDDDGGDPTCAAGFVLKGGICVKPSDNLGGSGTTAGTAATAGKDQGAAGDATTGGAGGAGGMAGEGPVAPYVAPTRWLVFSHESGVFAYDTTKFPESSGLTQLSEKTQVTEPWGLLWSPDGRTLLYLDVSDVYAVDLSGDTPSAFKLLLSTPTAPSPQLNLAHPWSWSADSSSVAVVSGTTLSVLDPAQAAPTLHPLTTKLKSYSWAPHGGRLRFADDTGSYVVQVTQGKPSAAVAVDAGATVWSPNGAQLAGLTGGDLALTTLNGDEASLELLTTVHEAFSSGGGGGVDPLPALDAGYIQFNKSGSKLTFSGQLTVDENSNGYTLALKPRGEPVPVPSDAPDDADTSCRSWSPDGELLLCGYSNAAGTQWFAVDPVAGDIKILGVGSTGDWTWSPEPSHHQLFATSVDGTQQITMVDLAEPSIAVPIFVGSTAFSVSPAGTLITYLTTPTIRLVDLAAPKKALVELQTDPAASEPPAWGWSPNGQFIAVADGSHQQRLARIDGADASTPVALGGSSAVTIYFAWQP